MLVEKLRTHVEDADAANALETAEGSKAASRLTFELYLAPRNEGTLMLPEIQHPLFALKPVSYTHLTLPTKRRV